MPVSKRFRLFVIIAFLMLAVAAMAWLRRPPPPLYTVTDLGTLPGDDDSRATAINNRGEIVGTSSGISHHLYASHTFLFRNGKMLAVAASNDPDDPDGPAINDKGQVTGQMASMQGFSHAFLYSAGKLQDLGTLPGFTASFGTGLNNQGEIVGVAKNSNARSGKPYRHAFLYRAGRMQDLTMPGNRWEAATGINDAGQIAMYSTSNPRCRVFIQDISTGRRTVLPVSLNSHLCFSRRINNRGQVIGDVFDAQGCHAALWSGGAMTDIGKGSSAIYINSGGINNQGVVVGSTTNAPGMLGNILHPFVNPANPLHKLVRTEWEERAFLYKAGMMADLNDLIAPDADWTLEMARGINDKGQIVGQGLHHGQERAFLLTPVR